MGDRHCHEFLVGSSSIGRPSPNEYLHLTRTGKGGSSSSKAKHFSLHQGASGRTIFTGALRNKFSHLEHNSRSAEENLPLITKLDKYSTEELKEYRQVFDMFDADRSGAIGLEELERAIMNLGMDLKQIDVEMLMKEADKRGNQQIDFDEFCEVMKATSEKTQSWNEVIKECFKVFDRNESGSISRDDFEFVLSELGEIRNIKLIDDLFKEYDVDNDGFIDFDEFAYLVKEYLTDEDVM